MEKLPSVALSSIYSEIAIAGQERQYWRNEGREWGRSSRALQRKAFGILNKYGESKRKIFTDDERADYLETPPVSAEIHGRKIQLTIVYAIAPSYMPDNGEARNYYKKAIVVQSVNPDSSEENPKQLFSMDNSGIITTNWVGEVARIDQIEMMSTVLSFIKESLSEGHAPKS